MEGKSWYETGFSGAEREAERKELGGAPTRFWLKGGECREGVLIDDIPFCFFEHSWKAEGQRQPEFATCIIKIHDVCDACSSTIVQKAEYTGHLTMIDCTGYTSKKDGKEHKYELVEVAPKTKVMNKLKIKKEKRGSMIGQLWSFTRTDEHSPNTGDDIEWIREVNMDGLYPLVTYKGKKIKEMIDAANGTGPESVRVRKFLCHHFQVPAEGPIPDKIPCLNYAKLHEPMEPAEFRKAIAGAQSFQSKFGNSTSAPAGAKASADDDVPF